MLDPICQTEYAYRDTVLTKAEGHGLDQLARHYSFPRLAPISRKYWRRALIELVYGCRGTPGTTWAVLEAMFDHFAKPRMVHSVTLDPADPTALIHEDARVAGGAPGWDCGSTGRWVRFETGPFAGKLYYSAHIANDRLYLSPVDTAYWNGASWAGLDAPVTGVKVKVIPFAIREPQPGPPWLDGVDEAGEYWHPFNGDLNLPVGDVGFLTEKNTTYEIYIDEFVWPLPRTYLQEDGTIDRTVVAPGQPFGGHMMSLIQAANDPDIPESGDPLGLGPHPIYFGSETMGAQFFSQLMDSILAAGVWADTTVLTWCDQDNFNAFGAGFDLSADTIADIDPSRLQALPLADVDLPWDFQIHGLPFHEGE